MREIKFRAWDFVKNEWFYFTLQQLLEHEIDLRLLTLKWENQYTGLKDKNGNEIYEGDIIKFLDVGEDGYEYKEGYDFENIASVVFERGRYTLKNFVVDDAYVADDGYETIIEEVLDGKCEVIGNIYENPELIQGIQEKLQTKDES
jgi:uncharacterized phage protein (TIGR01671 family)